MRHIFITTSILSLIIIGATSLIWLPALWILLIVIPLVMIGLYDMLQHKHSLKRTFPLLGRGRWVMEFFRPFIRQYFIESETDGVPINRMFRAVIYQRAKGDLDTVPYGTKVDTYRVGYEWIAHSMAALHVSDDEAQPRIRIGGPDCSQPYLSSILNVSAMSFGALSHNAIRALNSGAKKGGFSHNTGEGGASPYHFENGGDLVWQIGTGYFGCRTKSGDFCSETFKEVASNPVIKMIEIKLSQGAKPSHGGILPAEKNTPEIAKIRDVEPYTRVDSPPTHSAFSTPIELTQFIGQLRVLSKGKPIGFKLSIGRMSEFMGVCKAMVATGIKPDFITVDGGEGGTGAAPLEFNNSVGMPLRDALAFVSDCLIGFGLRDDIKIIASGKIFTGFHIVKNLALGADICNSARGMMLALGCIQSLECNTNKCPVGVTTQNPALSKGIVVTEKSERVLHFQKETVRAAMELIASAGMNYPSQLNRTHILRRVSQSEIKRYDQVFPYPTANCFLSAQYPKQYAPALMESSADSFSPLTCYAHYETGLIELITVNK